jgi:hypothetical protein
MKIGVIGEGGKILVQFSLEKWRHVAAFFVIFDKVFSEYAERK